MNRLSTELSILIAGLLGALLSIGSSSSRRLRDNLLSLVAGTLSAYYLTPVVMGIFAIAETNIRVQYGIAFLLGRLGLRGVEVLINYILPIMGDTGKPKPRGSGSTP